MGRNSEKTTAATNRGKTVNPATLVSALQASCDIDPLTPTFIQWCQGGQGLNGATAAAALKPVKALATAYFDLVPEGDITGFQAEAFSAALDSTLDHVAHQGSEALEHAAESIRLYIEFLGDTQAWTGTEADYNVIAYIFDDSEEAQLNVPDLTSAEELEGLANTVLAQRLEALLLWIGKGKNATATRTLRLTDIAGAAAAIGVAVRGSTPAAKKTQDALFGDEEPSEDREAGESVRTVKTMNDEPRLSLFWAVLKASFLIEFGAATVRRTPLAEKFLAGRPEDKLAVLRDFTAKFIAATVNTEDEWDPVDVQASVVKASVLLASTTDSPPSAAGIRRAPNRSGDLVADAPAGAVVLEWLDYMVELGIFSGGTHIQLPPALIGVVAAIMEHATGFDDDPGYEVPLSDVEPHATAPTQPAKQKKPDPKAAIFQVKVAIRMSWIRRRTIGRASAAGSPQIHPQQKLARRKQRKSHPNAYFRRLLRAG